jgi:hypothetical protein
MTDRITDFMDFEAAAAQFQEAVVSAYNGNCPLTERRNYRNVPRWNRDLSEKKRRVRRLFNATKKLGDWTDYKRSLTDYSKALRQAKETHGRDIVRRLKRLQKVPDSTGFSQREARVPSVPLSWTVDITPHRRRKPCRNYCGSIFLAQK